MLDKHFVRLEDMALFKDDGLILERFAQTKPERLIVSAYMLGLAFNLESTGRDGYAVHKIADYLELLQE